MSKKNRDQSRSERAAQAIREQQAAERRNRMLMIGGVVVALALVVAIVFAVVNATGGDDSSTARDGGDGGTPSAVVDGAIPVGEDDAPVTVDLYYDYMCPACGAFEQVNGADLGGLIDDGTIKVNLRVMNFLDSQSNGSEYSTRAGNAVAVTAVEAPEAVWDLHNALYANQPSEGTEGLSDEEIASIATDVGVPEEVAATFADGAYDDWVSESNEAAFDADVTGTPTVKINGETFEGNWSQPGTLAAAIEAEAGA